MRRILLFILLSTVFLAAGCGTLIKVGGDQDRVAVSVVRAVDGDTIKVFMDGKEESVRLLLVDTPESVKPNHPVEPFGKESSAFVQEMLAGKQVELEFGNPDRDRYDRLLAYVWIDGELFNELLLEEGFARVAYVYPPNDKYEDRLREAEAQARKSKIGIWSIDGYVLEDGFHEEAGG